MKIRKVIFVIILIASMTNVFGQGNGEPFNSETQNVYGKHSIGSTVFLLGNLAPGDPPYFFQLNYGYYLSPKDVIITEAITWTNYEPLGTYGSSEEVYPGKVMSIGIGVGYQRFHWKNLYTTIQATPFLQTFFDEHDEKIQNSFQLFAQFRVGYRFELFKHRWFIEPSVAFNYWPINTNVPKSFEEINDGTENYFLFEPGLHFGYRF